MSITSENSQNIANDKSFANELNIWILQHNCARSMQIMHACMKFAKIRANIVILQESWMKDENIIILHSSFIYIKSNIQKTWVKVLIFVAKNIGKFICTSRSNIVNSKDIQAIMIVNNKISDEILLLNIYNEKAQNAKKKQSYMIEQELAKIKLNDDQKVIIAEDFNVHHNWWNVKIANLIRTKALVNWVRMHDCDLINTLNINTYYNYFKRLSSVIDLAFASRSMQNYIKNWHVNEDADTKFNHEVILFTIVTEKMKLVENSLNTSYNLQKVDWKRFDMHLQKTKNEMIIKMQRTINLKTKVIYLIECIKSAVKLFVFKQQICAKLKLWWNDELIKMWKAQSLRKWIWKRCKTDDAWTEIMRMQNSYHDAIKLIKNQFWINFLNKVEEKKVFQTYKFIKSINNETHLYVMLTTNLLFNYSKV